MDYLLPEPVICNREKHRVWWGTSFRSYTIYPFILFILGQDLFFYGSAFAQTVIVTDDAAYTTGQASAALDKAHQQRISTSLHDSGAADSSCRTL